MTKKTTKQKASTEPVISPAAAAKILRAPEAHCWECPLLDQPMVPGYGPADAKVALVGEAPGATEVAQQRPFVGQSGQLLNEVLMQNGVARKDIYVTNAVLCRPPANATPTAKMLKACRPRLIQELKQIQPELVIALGSPAAKTLLNDKEGITRQRIGGRRHVEELGCDVAPTFHPAAALRVPDHLPSLVSDIGAAVNIKVGWEPTDYKAAQDIETAIRWLEWQTSHPECALDIEVDVPRGERPNAHKIDWLCIGIAHEPGRAIVYPKHIVEHRAFQLTLARIMADSRTRWVYQNGKFDIQFLWSFAPAARVDEDSMLMSYAVDERKGTHDLEQLATKYLHAPNWKTEARSYLPTPDSPYSLLPPELLWRYNATDVDSTLRLMAPLRKEMDSDGVTEVYNTLLIPGSDVLARAEYQGVAVDEANLDRLEEELSERHDILEQELSRWVSNPRSNPQVLKALNELGIATDTTNKEVLAHLDEDFARALLDYRRVRIRRGTFVRGLRKHIRAGRVHATFKLHGTEVGRLSCSNPNLQNQPRQGGFRDTFISGEGRVFVAADYANIEYRAAGVLSGDRYIIEAFKENRNLHEEAAREFYSNYKGKKDDEERYTNVKTVNFGVLYRETAGSLSHRTTLSYKEAEGLIQAFNARQPQLRRWQGLLMKEAKERGYLTSAFGRKRRFWLITPDNEYDVMKEACAFPTESLASDLTLRSLIKLEPMLREIATPVITVHDSLMFETTPEHADFVAGRMTQVMEDNEDIMGEVPTPIEIKVGTAWGSLEEV